jgi:hypothetical protein
MKPPRPLPIPEYVRKVRTSVRVSLPGTDVVEGFLSLAPQAEYHDGPQTVLERLNAAERFLPIQRTGERDVLLLNPRDIELATCPSR